jgi:hypothetical protein
MVSFTLLGSGLLGSWSGSVLCSKFLFAFELEPELGTELEHELSSENAEA